MGALYLLARSFEDPQKLNYRGYSLYCDFRPGGGGWGARGDVKLAYILRLREGSKPVEQTVKPSDETEESHVAPEVKREVLAIGDLDANDDEDFSLWDLYDGDD